MSGAEAATRKKQCIEELRSPTSPTVATPKLSFVFKPPEERPNMPSPTTALARLKFDQPSPIAERPSPIMERPSPVSQGGSEMGFPSLPTTSLDKLAFTPCATITPPLTLNITINKPLGGTKRPLALGVEEATGASGSDPPVTLRSPETKSKRPLVRPNSIAFSSYPKFELGGEGGQRGGEVRSETRPRSPSLDPPSPAQRMETDRPPVQMRQKTPGSRISERGGLGLGLGLGLTLPFDGAHSFEQARKSRSLEDILNSPDTENTGCGCPVRPRKLVQAADMFAPPGVLESVNSCRRHGPADPHHSSSSISSSGSLNSLHGSLEIIQVS